MATSRKFPWSTTLPGEYFFIPTLDTDLCIMQGLRAAALLFGSTASIRATPAVYQGMLGVMFYRRAKASA